MPNVEPGSRSNQPLSFLSVLIFSMLIFLFPARRSPSHSNPGNSIQGHSVNVSDPAPSPPFNFNWHWVELRLFCDKVLHWRWFLAKKSWGFSKDILFGIHLSCGIWIVTPSRTLLHIEGLQKHCSWKSLVWFRCQSLKTSRCSEVPQIPLLPWITVSISEFPSVVTAHADRQILVLLQCFCFR